MCISNTENMKPVFVIQKTEDNLNVQQQGRNYSHYDVSMYEILSDQDKKL